MDEKIISAIQEYKNKQKKYNSKLKESLKKEVLQTQQPKSNNSIQKKQELEELRRELDLLNDLDNFDHLPPDLITDKDTPSYEEYDEDKSNNDYDEYLIIKENNSNISEPIEHSVTTNDDFLNELDSLSSSLEQEPYHQVDLSAKTISNNDIFSELSSSQKSDLSIETSVQDEQQYLDSIEHSPNDDFFSELDELSFSLKQDLSIQESIQQETEFVKNTEESTNELDIFNELDDLSSSQEPDSSIQESIQQEPEIVKNTENSTNESDIFNELDDLSSSQEPDSSIQESIQQEPEIVKNTENSTNESDIFNELDDLSSSQEPDSSIQESIQQEPEIVKNTENSTNESDIFNELDDLSSSQEPDLSIQESIQQETEFVKNTEESTNESDIFNELDDLSSSQEPDLSIQESIQQETEFVKNTEESTNELDIFNELDDLSSSQEPDLSIQESIQQEPEIVKNTEKSTNELDIFNDLDNLSSFQEPDLSIQESICQEPEIVKNTEKSTNELDIFNDLDNLSSSQEPDLSIQESIQQESEESEIIKPIDEFTNESSTVKVNDNVDQTIEFLDQLADSIIEEPKNENGEFLEMQENLKLLDEISQNPDLREQIYQKNSLKNDLISSKEENNNKPISLYLEESNTENSILESDLHFSLEAELHSLNEEFQLTDKVAEPPKFIIQEPKPKKIDKKSPLIELDNIPKFQNETQDYIKLDQKIPVAENPPTWTPDEELIKILEAKKELRLIQSETDKILAACSFFNPKLFKTYLYPEIHLEEALLVGDFFINKSNDFFDFHFITVQLSFLIDMKFILHQLISYMNEKYKKDQSDETRMQISKLNSFEFKLHKFIHKLAIPASKESVPGDIKNLLKNKQTLEVSLMNKQEFLFFLDQKVHFYE